GVLRRQPANHIAAQRLISFLSSHTFVLPMLERFPHEKAVLNIVPSPDGNHLLTGSLDGGVRVWNMSGGQLERTFLHGAHNTSPAWSPKGQYIAAGFFDCTARVWDAVTGQEVSPVLPHSYAPQVLFSGDGERLLTWGWLEPTIRIWNW